MKNESPYNKMLKTKLRFSKPIGIVKVKPSKEERKARAAKLLKRIDRMKRTAV